MLNQLQLKKLNAATGVPGLNRNQVYAVKLGLPPLREQQKIASILSKVDELIQKTDQIIEQTQRLKKGLMQRLLTKGIGHTRFKTVLDRNL
jgi:type I restriction enzyme S subunit